MFFFVFLPSVLCFCVFFFLQAPTFCEFLFRMFFFSVTVTDLSVKYIASTGKFHFFLVREFLSKICLFDFFV